MSQFALDHFKKSPAFSGSVSLNKDTFRVIKPLAEFHEFPWHIISHSEFFDNLIKTRGKDN
ncbi:hypothetical protein [Acinetobacter pittii]|uniref:hypothetical protein n=1 Tax=Acinetobacter pittii TaxID=48296 RepID=UPI00083F6249|nr:hypothetical protein [Acinetobacter pittii]AQV16013.1 hypothetical protein BMU11_10725 [Acinetobacter pittii]ODL95769.1 hypothetical protein AXH21_09855 [Acinetobacter pittii]